MNREPLFATIFRLLLIVGILFFMGMLYWSSLLLEKKVEQVHIILENVQKEFKSIKEFPISTRSLDESGKQSKERLSVLALQKNRKHIDKSLPNLLEEDPFFASILPKMLGLNFIPQGKIKSASFTKPENLHPFSQWADVSRWINMCSVSVASSKFGYYETFAPDMAIKMELRENKETKTPEYWIHLRDDVYYEPLRQQDFSDDIKLAPHFLTKHQVTAHDFKFYLDAVMNPAVQEPGAISLRSYLADIEEFKVIDDVTFTVRWKSEPFQEDDGKIIMRPKYIAKLWTSGLQPLATFVYQYFPDGTKIAEEDGSENFYRTNTIWGQNFSRHFAKNVIVSCGPWIFDGFSERQIQFKRNSNFFNPFAALAAVKVFEFKQSPESIWQDFKSDNLDSYAIQPDQLVELEKFLKTDLYKNQLEKGRGIERLDYIGRRYVNIQWNEARPFFESKYVRQALTMAIDRQRIIKQFVNRMGIEISGPFFRYSKAYDNKIQPYPFDPHKARLLLEQEGWYDSDGDGIIDKEIEGQRIPFRFYLTYYVKNALGKAICEYISAALKEVGIDCRLNGMDVADISATFDDKNFDALFFIWGYGSPPEDPEQLWSSSLAKVKGSSNAIGFQNKEADEIIQKLKMEYNEDERIKLYHRFSAIIHEEAPYTFLYTPKISFLYRQYLQNVFIPADRQDILPGANIQEPESSIFWIKKDDV